MSDDGARMQDREVVNVENLLRKINSEVSRSDRIHNKK